MGRSVARSASSTDLLRCAAMHRAFALIVGMLVLAACDEQPSNTEAAPHPRPPSEPEPHDAGVAPSKPSKPMTRDGGTSIDAGHLPDSGASAAQCPAGACDLLDPLSCAEGEGCLLALDEADAGVGALPQCAPVGAGLDGDACQRSSDCGPGLDCTAFDGSGTCRRYCCALNRSQGCPEGQFCRVGLRVDMASAGAALCDQCDGCDPMAADACSEGLACYPLSGASECMACLPAGTALRGSACTQSTECARGSACFRVSAEGSRCVVFCDLQTGAGCESGTSCRAVTGAALSSGLGLCL